jgi:hypothetical protein
MRREKYSISNPNEQTYTQNKEPYWFMITMTNDLLITLLLHVNYSLININTVGLVARITAKRLLFYLFILTILFSSFSCFHDFSGHWTELFLFLHSRIHTKLKVMVTMKHDSSKVMSLNCVCYSRRSVSNLSEIGHLLSSESCCCWCPKQNNFFPFVYKSIR